nr:KEOPS complex subunit Pcc1 [Salinarchaeum sp. Harcht-Bsk1]
MTGDDQTETTDATEAVIGTRRATITSEVDSPATVAAAIAPDDTEEIDTRVEDGLVVSTIERETTGGLEATIDDYVVALDVATTTAGHATVDEAGIEAAIEESQTDSTAEQLDERHDTDSP